MDIEPIIKRLIPKAIRQFARGLYSSLRYSVICRSIPNQRITGKPVLIVSPHPDDETFACGGLISLKRAAGINVRVIILTDGEAVADGLCELRETVVAARQREALEASRRLGLESASVRFLHLPDGKLPHPGRPGFNEAARALLAEIKTFSPGEIYCPHSEDVHSDHIAAMRLTHEALRLWSRPCAIVYYPVWMWYHSDFGLLMRLNTIGAWRLDIAAVKGNKEHAMSAYLDAPKSSLGYRFCGSLPEAFVHVFRRRYEVYFPDLADAAATGERGRVQNAGTSKISPKALFISPAGAVYGSERSMLALLRERRFEAEVVCPVGGALEQELQRLGVRIHPMQFGKYAVIDNPFWHIGFYRRLRRILKQSRPNVVVINLDGNTALATMAAIRAGIPIIRFCRFEFKSPSRWIDRWSWRQPAAIICPSDFVKRQVLAWAPPKFHSRVVRLYDAYGGRTATSHEIDAFRREFRLGDDKLIGYVGRLDRGKRIETAIKALAGVRKRIGTARLVISGGPNAPDEVAYLGQLQQLAVNLGIGDATAFIGYRGVDEMAGVFASLDVCVLPSASESFGMVLIEAWAQSIPTVASDVGACREISKASAGGYLASVGNTDAFVADLVALLSNSDAATAMGERGRDWVEQNCSPTTYARTFESLIHAYKSDGS